MTPLNMNAQDADSISTKTEKEHKFPWKWKLEDLANVPKNGKTVFSCFSCGGGSSMGYKLAGYTLLGNVEIDPSMNKVYNLNHHPKHSYLMDVRDFLAQDNAMLPEELFHLDILDGSPPCSVFSTAGEREKGWGTEKVFREGQKKQRLDDLFFSFIKIAEKLKPKVVIAENVRGLISGNARGYVREIFQAFREAGYEVQLFLLNAARMGVPQSRERVFFIAHRADLQFPKLKLEFNEPLISFGEVRSKAGVRLKEGSMTKKLMDMRIPTDQKISDINQRLYGKNVGFTNCIWSDNQVCGTITSGGSYFRMYDGQGMSAQDYVAVQSFPQDYDFLDQSPKYICGMSVPPVMEAQIANQVYIQWLSSS